MDDNVKSYINETAKTVAEETVTRTLIRYGLDTSNPVEMQRDFAYWRDVRLAAESRKAKFVVVAFSTLMSLLGALALLAIQHGLSAIK